ncbi:MAG: uncharacterized membrane protein YcgQ (UPF0703/DUF1980 family) [Cyclobacteriaceae bacterium]|jgi:uncharacterized membrane protein YcgQ (UPF0703/DUF1980 family)
MIYAVAIVLTFLQSTGWDLLSNVEMTRKYDDMMGQEIDVPIFSDELSSMHGETITLTGYVIPLEAGAEQAYFVLSRFPYQSCFFCGAAGPETVIEVYPIVTSTELAPDQRITVSGKLSLNQKDPMHLFFVLKSAEII